MRKPLSLYVHIPFCSAKCAYCNFVSQVGSVAEKVRYVNNLIEEIKMRARIFNPLYKISTIYIGGGTPSTLLDGDIRRILKEIYSRFTVANRAEITVEVNPESLTETKVLEYVSAGVNRISIGLQCAQDSLLKLMGRKHSVEDFEKTIDMIRAGGIHDISSDAIIGYPGQKLAWVSETVEKLIELEIPHISVYMLNVEDGTKLSELIGEGILKPIDEKTMIKMYHTVHSILKSAGYNRYELSNFAKVGYRSAHNINYWKRNEYLGLGVAAHSFVDDTRLANHDDLSDYNSCIEKFLKPPVEFTEKVEPKEAEDEFVMLSIRLAEGIDTSEYEKQFGKNFFAEKKQILADLIKLGFLVIDGDHIKATNSGFMVLNRIILELTS